jgi:dihydrofolate reductase
VSRPEIVFVVARADNGVIGRDGGMPWRIPGEQKHFKALTMGAPMAMGRRTFESLPGLLPGRAHIVLTRDANWSAPGAIVVGSVEEAVAAAGDAERLSVIGGAEIYALFMAVADRIELTEVHGEFAGDTLMPPIPTEEWRETAREEIPGGDGIPAMSYVTLRRR